jgi:hypothetical protein
MASWQPVDRQKQPLMCTFLLLPDFVVFGLSPLLHQRVPLIPTATKIIDIPIAQSRPLPQQARQHSAVAIAELFDLDIGHLGADGFHLVLKVQIVGPRIAG